MTQVDNRDRQLHREQQTHGKDILLEADLQVSKVNKKRHPFREQRSDFYFHQMAISYATKSARHWTALAPLCQLTDPPQVREAHTHPLQFHWMA